MDLFEDYEALPQNVLDVLSKHEEGDFSYKTCEALKSDLEAIGYTCDYGLDASPYGLKVLNCPVCDSTDTRDDYDFPDSMNCCESCLADFLNDGEVTLDPREII